MKLGDPFNGPVFDQMFAEAVDTVTGNLLQGLASGGETKTTLTRKVSDVLTQALNNVAFGGLPGYSFSADNSVLVGKTANDAGQPYTLTETIISEAYTDSSTGDIPAWFVNPKQAIASLANEKSTADALTPSFAQRVAATIFAPFGITGSTAILYLKILAAVAILIGLAYVIRTFKR
jgi:hypothetical protein